MSSVDVTVPCYRYAHFRRESVESVLTQRERVTYVRHAVNKGHMATYDDGPNGRPATT